MDDENDKPETIAEQAIDSPAGTAIDAIDRAIAPVREQLTALASEVSGLSARVASMVPAAETEPNDSGSGDDRSSEPGIGGSGAGAGDDTADKKAPKARSWYHKSIRFKW